MIRRILLLGVIVSLLGGAAGWHFASEKMLRPLRRPLEERLIATLDVPQDYGMAIERFAVTTKDGFSLSAMRVRPHVRPGEAVKGRRLRALLPRDDLRPWGETRGTIFLLHGRGGRMEYLLPVVERFVAGGFDCVLYSARAHGDSGGKYTTYGKRESDDLAAVIDAADARFGRAERQFLWGLSLGGAVSVLALHDLEQIDGAVIVAAFADLRSQGRHSVIRGRCPAPLAGFAVHSLAVAAEWKAGFGLDDVRPVIAAQRIHVPTMIVHGEKDRVIPITHGRRLFESLPDGAENVWRSVPEGYHGNVLARGGDQLYAEMVAFFVERCQ